jgi:uncharacterized repeat protein (TIGR01451 family)
VTGMIVGLAAVLPSITSAETAVAMQGSLSVANVTAGDKTYKDGVAAASNEVVKVQLYYQNGEAADSNKSATKVRVKLAMPTQAGKGQTVSASVKGENTDELKDQTTVTLDRDDATLQYIPGSAVWKHNTGSAEAPKVEESKLSDEVVNGAQGMVLEDAKPGDAYAATVSILARVMVPGVKLENESQLQSDTNKWSANSSASAGATLKYLVSYQNTGSGTQKQVVVRDVLPPKVQLVPDTTVLYNTTNPNGLKLTSNDIAGNGVNVGNYGPGANAYVIFQAKIADAAQLVCGSNDLRNVSSAKPDGLSEYFNSSVTTVNRDCSAVKVPTPPNLTPMQPSPQPAYSCDLLTLTKGDGRKVTAKVDYTAKDGAKLKTVTYNFGDASQPLVTDKTTTDHTYAKDGDYTVAVSLVFTVNGKDQTATSAACAKPVSFAAATPTPPAAKGSDLPSTGPGNVIGLFIGASTLGFLGHRLVLSRRFVR